jgi:hypothetical protein
MRALTAVGGAMAVIFFIKAYRFDRAHRAAHKKLGLPEK